MLPLIHRKSLREEEAAIKIFHAFPKKALEGKIATWFECIHALEGENHKPTVRKPSFMAGICIYSFICNHNEAETNERVGKVSRSFFIVTQ